MTYEETVAHLYTLRNQGTKLGLGPMGRLLEALGNPQKRFSSIHIAGTNGKGSTAAMAAAILKEAGIRTGLYTSPHLVRFTERITVDGIEITEKEVVGRAGKILEIGRRRDINLTFFEVATALAFWYFADQGVAWTVAEVGLGGRLDATNVLEPFVTAITNVDIDHQAYLGETLEAIAEEKAGILKPGVPGFTAAQGLSLGVITARADRLGVPLAVFGRDFRAENVRDESPGIAMDYVDGAGRIEDLVVPLSGRHQAENAALAVALCRTAARTIPGLTENSIRTGIGSVRWPGRVEEVRWNGPSPLVVDAGHNSAAAEVLAKTLSARYGDRRIVCILGILNDKDVAGIAAPLAGVADRFIATAPPGNRALSPGDLARRLVFTGKPVETADTVAEALALARAGATERTLIVVTGSFYTAGEVKALLGEQGCLSSLRE